MMRQALVVSAVVLAGLGLDLTIAPTSTARYFSWPIEPPLTAQALGAFYLAALAILLLSIRGWVWTRVRAVLPGGILFSAMAFAATMMHLSKFNFDAPGSFAKVITWVWTVAYLILPPVLLIALIPQRREPGGDRAAEPSPPGLRAAMAGLGAVMVITAAILYAVPEQAARVWPWDLTALTGRALASWIGGLGLLFVAAAADGNRDTMEGPAVGLVLLGAFQMLSLVRFGDDVAWGESGAWIYVAFLAAAALVGAVGLHRALRPRAEPVHAAAAA
jgi:hypothetical protein